MRVGPFTECRPPCGEALIVDPVADVQTNMSDNSAWWFAVVSMVASQKGGSEFESNTEKKVP